VSEPPGARLRAVVVDDEELARAVVREHLAAHPDVDVVAECANGLAAVKAIAGEGGARPDLVFLDVQMPKLDGFEVLELIEPGPAVIFVTAYDQYALRAFEVNAVDYLLKPFTRERFDAALARARERVAAQRGKVALPRIEPPRALTRLAVKDGSRVTIVPLKDVDYVKAEDDYVAIRSGGRDHLKQQTISSLEEQLDPCRFVRIHRSYLVNLDRLARLEAGPGGTPLAVLHDGTRLPVSRAGAARLKQVLDGGGVGGGA